MRDTIDMAREVYGAHTEWSGAPLDRLEQLVALVRADEQNKQCEAFQQILSSVKAIAIADEREACAKLCENWTQTPETTGMELALCATAIRNRKNT